MKRTLTYRFVNALGGIFRDLHLMRLDLNPEELCETARRRAGLTDFGGDEFRVPLGVLVRSLEEEADLTFVGRVFVREILVQKLMNRLLLAESLRRHPGILCTEIRRPIFITGLPRTGTTLLHRVMAQDPCLRHLQMWEVWQPAPPPAPETYDTDARRWARPYNNSEAPGLAGVVCALEDQLLGPETIRNRQAAHFVDMAEPEECQLLMMNSFTSQEFILFFADAVPSYVMWLLQQDLTPSYEYYRMQLQALTWRFPGRRLVLKSPMHLQDPGALFRVFPDATMVWCHREPRSVVLSWSSLNRIDGEIYNNLSSGGAIRLGPSVLQWLGAETDKAMAVLPELPRGQVLHVSYEQCAGDTLRTALNLRERIGIPESREAVERIQAWIRNNPANKHGVRRYEAADFGLTHEAIDSRFRAYQQAFGQYLTASKEMSETHAVAP